MALEDFTTYTEVDPNTHIAVTENHLDTNVSRGEDAYLYHDKGAAHFGNFEHLLTVKLVSPNTVGLFTFVWALTNDIDDIKALNTASKQYLAIDFYRYQTQNPSLQTRALGKDSQGYTVSFDTWYYLTIQRIGSTFTCKIYSDQARTSLLTTLTTEDVTEDPFRYVFGVNTWNDGFSAILGNVYIDDLDLQEALPAPGYVWIF